jgi:hypothetical protein
VEIAMHRVEMQVKEHLKNKKFSFKQNKEILYLLPESIEPVHAVQPITGGIAPTIDPNHVLIICFLFIGV